MAKVPTAAEAPVSSGDREVDSALKFIEKMPESPLGYVQLAAVYIKKARLNSDFQLNNLAETAIKKALEISPNDPASRKIQASLHLTFHRFNEALVAGQQLVKEFPDDAFIYGVLTDANTELGNYSDAVAAAQKMVDLKPNSNSYARVARMRSLHGDHQGSVEMYKLAARTADPQDKEAQSWCLVQLGDEYWKNGKYREAEAVFNEALSLLPDYVLALEGKGRVRASLGDLAGAEKFLMQAQERVPQPKIIVQLAQVYSLLGNADKSKLQYDLFEAVDQKLAGDQRELALSWADRNIRLDEALEIAAREYEVRKDVYTADVYAWCLFKKARYAEAKKIITKAMQLNTSDARIMYHAGMIEHSLGNKKDAERLLIAALKLNPAFDLIQASVARETLVVSK